MMVLIINENEIEILQYMFDCLYNPILLNFYSIQKKRMAKISLHSREKEISVSMQQQHNTRTSSANI